MCGYYNIDSFVPGGTSSTGGNGMTGRLFSVGSGTSTVKSNSFSVDRDGNTYTKKTAFSGYADYGEFMESYDGTSIPVGTSVVIVEGTNKIKICENGEIPIGVISNTASFVGNAAGEEWVGKYIQPNGEIEYETIIQEYTENVTEEVTETRIIENIITDSEGNISIKQVEENYIVNRQVYDVVPVYDIEGNIIEYRNIPRTIIKKRSYHVMKVSPLYDPNKEYIPRIYRPEWNIVGIVGIVKIKNDQPINPNWVRLNPSQYDPENITYWLIK